LHWNTEPRRRFVPTLAGIIGTRGRNASEWVADLMEYAVGRSSESQS